MPTTSPATAATNAPRLTTDNPVDDSGPLFDATRLAWTHPGSRNRLRIECDNLADELTQTFEELYCLRRMASEVSACDVSQDLHSAAELFLTPLREILSAQTVILVLEPNSQTSLGLRVWKTPESPAMIQAGDHPVALQEAPHLVRQFNHWSSNEAIVFNRDSNLCRAELETATKNLVAVPLAHQQCQYGWLMAVDRLPGCSPGEFGSRDVNLLATAATMLAGHVRNVELFRAEERLRTGVIEAITSALDARDPYTCGHSRRVAQLAVQIAEELGMSADARERLYITGLLHDVGKIGVPDTILLKPDKLTDEEFGIIKQHPTIGHQILSPLEPLNYVLPGVLHHHERIDGRGYPHGLSGDIIPLDARILAVADSYDAMTSDRAYRSGMPTQRAIDILSDGKDQQWDAEIVQAFLSQ